MARYIGQSVDQACELCITFVSPPLPTRELLCLLLISHASDDAKPCSSAQLFMHEKHDTQVQQQGLLPKLHPVAMHGG